MDSFFKMSEFKTNRFLLILIGLWPFKINFIQKVLFLFFIFCVFCQVFLQTGTLIVASKEGDIDVVLEAILNIVLDCIAVAYIILWIIHFNKMKQILKDIYSAWQNFSPDERKILKKYAIKSRKITVTYAWILYGTMGPYMIFLLYPILTKSLSRKTATTMQFIFPVKNFFNIQNYYYYLLAMTYCGTISIITTFVAFDTIFATFIQQACGMFAILMQRLETITTVENTINSKSDVDKNKNCKVAISSLKLHQIVIDFSDLLNSAFSFGLLISTTLNTVLLSFTVFSAREYHHTPLLMWRYAILTSAEIFHLFNKFWQCQTLIDHSVMFRNSIYASNWYNASANTKLILRFMLMRSEKVCKVTAGKFFDMSFHTFRKILSTAASYFTVLSAIK